MRITRRATLPAGVEDAFAVIATQDYQQEKVSTQADATATVTRTREGLVVVHTARTLATRGMPPAVVSMAGETLTITEQQSWGPAMAGGSRRADLEIAVGGLPLRLRGTLTLAPDGEGSTIAVDAHLTCSIPLLGRTIEQAAAPTIEGSIDFEARLLSERLT